MRMIPLALLAACSDYELGDARPEPSTCDVEGPGIDHTCSEPLAEVTPGGLDPVVKWRAEPGVCSYVTPVVAPARDTDGDGLVGATDRAMVFVVDEHGGTYALDGDTGARIWHAPGPEANAYPHAPAVGDVDGDGAVELLVGGCKELKLLDAATGAVRWTANPISGECLGAGGFALADLDGDGAAEAVWGNVIFDPRTGGHRRTGDAGVGYGAGGTEPIGVVTDLDGDGRAEALVGNAAYDDAGEPVWTNGALDGTPSPAELDGDAAREVVVATHEGLRLQDADGSVLWERPGIAGEATSPAAVGDLDGDGVAEIVVSGPQALVALDARGEERWRHTVGAVTSGISPPSLADLDGDGLREVLYADETSLRILDGVTGALRWSTWEHVGFAYGDYPVVADLDADDHAEIVFVNCDYEGGPGVVALEDAADSWRDAAPVWAEHAWNPGLRTADLRVPGAPLPGAPNVLRGAGEVGPVQPDAVPLAADGCDGACTEGLATVVVAVGNAGTAPLPAGVTLRVVGLAGDRRNELATVVTEIELAPGEASPGLDVKFDATLAADGVELSVEEGDTCDDANTLVLPAPCP